MAAVSILQAAAGLMQQSPTPSPVTWAYSIADGSNRLLLFFMGTGQNAPYMPANVTYGGVTLRGSGGSQAADARLYDANEGVWPRTAAWYLLDADLIGLSGSNNFSFPVTASQNVWTAVLLQNVNQTTPFGTPQTFVNSGGQFASLTFDVVTDEMLVVSFDSDDSNLWSIQNGGTNFFQQDQIAGDTGFAAGYWTGNGSITASWNANNTDRHAIGGVVVKPAATAGQKLMINKYLKTGNMSRSEWTS